MQHAIRFLVLFAALAIVGSALAQQQQEEIIPLQVTPLQLDSLEKLLRVQKIEDFGLLYFMLNNQRNQYNQNKAAAQINDFERQVRSKIAADAAKAAEDKAKADATTKPADLPATPEEPKQ